MSKPRRRHTAEQKAEPVTPARSGEKPVSEVQLRRRRRCLRHLAEPVTIVEDSLPGVDPSVRMP